MQSLYINTSILKTNFTINCYPHSFFGPYLREDVSPFQYSVNKPVDCSKNVSDYDYLYFEMKSRDNYYLNLALIQHYIEQGFTIEYQQNYSLILKNEKHY